MLLHTGNDVHSTHKKIYIKEINVNFVNFVKFYNKYKELLLLIIISVILDLYILRNSLKIGIVQSADWSIPIRNFTYLYYDSLPAWNFQLMSSNGFNIFLLITGFFSIFSHNPALVQKLFYYVPWAITPLFSYLLLRYLGLKNAKLIFFSSLYQFGPYITGQFMDGEPGFVILYMFLPLFLFILLYFHKNLTKLYFYTTIGIMVPSFFTLEAPVFYILLAIPFLLYITVDAGIKRAAKTALILTFSYVTIILFNIYSILPYIDGYNGISSTPRSLLSSFVNFAPAVIGKYWLLIFLFGIIILTLALVIIKNNLRFFFIFFTFISILLVIIYPGLISNSIGIYLLTNIPIFAPFINPSDFILYLWFELFIISAYTSAQIINKNFHINKNKMKQLHKYVHKSLIISISLAIVILLISSATIEIQSLGSHDTDIYLFSDGTHFEKTQVSPQYIALENYLKEHGASFNLSEHTIILPENPNFTLPFFIGKQMIPGYEGLFGRNVSNAIINGINSENSSFLMLLSILGIRYLAVIDIPATPSPGWSETKGAPSYTGWGNKYIFVGNYTTYLDRLQNITKLSEVYNKNGLWIFENEYYMSPILESKYNLISDLFSQNYGKFYSITNLSGNILNNANWNYYGNYYFRNIGLNVTIDKNSSGVDIYNYTYIKPNSMYEFSFSFNTTGTNNTYFGAGQNSGMIVYNVTQNYSHIIENQTITISPENSANGTYTGTFDTGNFSGELPAKVIFQLQPPRGHNSINVTLSSVNLKEVKVTNNFSKYFKPVKYKITDLTTITLYNTTKNQTVILDQEWGSGWFIKNSPRKGIPDNNFQLLAFNNSLGGKFTLIYGFQKTYNYMIMTSIISIVGFVISISYCEMKIRHRKL